MGGHSQLKTRRYLTAVLTADPGSTALIGCKRVHIKAASIFQHSD